MMGLSEANIRENYNVKIYNEIYGKISDILHCIEQSYQLFY